jgi:hypothetical protein
MDSQNKKRIFFSLKTLHSSANPEKGLSASRIVFIEEKAPFFYGLRADLLAIQYRLGRQSIDRIYCSIQWRLNKLNL